MSRVLGRKGVWRSCDVGSSDPPDLRSGAHGFAALAPVVAFNLERFHNATEPAVRALLADRARPALPQRDVAAGAAIGAASAALMLALY